MKKNNRPIAILMATYNTEKYIAEQIESILNQTNHEWTLYIRDDASTDNTISIIKHYTDLYDNIILLEDSKGNLGCRDNFFELLLEVESQYYMFSDADDYWLPEKISDSYSMILLLEKSNPFTPIVVHTDMSITDSDLNITDLSMWRAGRFNPDKIKKDYYLCLLTFTGGATMIFNQEAKDISLPLNHNVTMHDFWIGLCVIRKGIVYSMHKSTMLYRQHSSNVAGGSSLEKLKLCYKIKNLKKVISTNYKIYKMLKKIGEGSILKYIYYKTKLTYMTRSGKMLD